MDNISNYEAYIFMRTALNVKCWYVTLLHIGTEKTSATYSQFMLKKYTKAYYFSQR